MLWPACSGWFVGVDTVVVPHSLLSSVVVQLLFLNKGFFFNMFRHSNWNWAAEPHHFYVAPAPCYIANI
jgi:hypothetical protein